MALHTRLQMEKGHYDAVTTRLVFAGKSLEAGESTYKQILLQPSEVEANRAKCDLWPRPNTGVVFLDQCKRNSPAYCDPDSLTVLCGCRSAHCTSMPGSEAAPCRPLLHRLGP